LANAGGIEARGAINTRREVVDFILDLVGYTADQPLTQRRLLEPSFGSGDFLLPAIERLLHSWAASGQLDDPFATLAPCIRGVELHKETFENARAKVTAHLMNRGIQRSVATRLSETWLVHGDYLLADLPVSFDFVVGNPPYVRQELIPDVLLNEYRRRYSTVYDRADLYIPFIERSLRCLVDRGVLGFICADRWMKNRYGGPLRALVAKDFRLKIYVDMTGTPAFHSEVIAYPAITVITREESGPTRIAHRPSIAKDALMTLSGKLTNDRIRPDDVEVRELGGITAGSEPWILESSDQMALVRRLERDFPTLEDAGCKVGIGVATGADKVYIGPLDELDVEPDRKLPLAMTRDIHTGSVVWRGFGVINPFADQGGLVSLNDYPRLRRHLDAHKAEISSRHCAQKIPANWYRTIDRITPSLARRPKLLIPDIKGEAQIVYEDGNLYPHHNLYFIISDEWDLRALQAVLLSGIARIFVSMYSTKMRGGYLRFQAQYLRRIRVPNWKDVPVGVRKELNKAADARDVVACDGAVSKLYRLTDRERAALGRIVKPNEPRSSEL